MSCFNATGGKEVLHIDDDTMQLITKEGLLIDRQYLTLADEIGKGEQSRRKCKTNYVEKKTTQNSKPSNICMKRGERKVILYWTCNQTKWLYMGKENGGVMGREQHL